MEKRLLDYWLVPAGLLMMVAYHIWLLYKIKKHPTTTVIGINSINRRYWIRSMTEDVAKNGILAVQTLRNNIMASTLLASTAIMLSSLIAVLMTGDGRSGGNCSSEFSIKFFSILVCFMVSFLLNVQSIRYYSIASILINVPYKQISWNNNGYHRTAMQRQHEAVTAEYVGKTVNKGSHFWSLGLRAFYFSFPLFLWIFGPIPMFLCCFVLIILLYFLDFTFDFDLIHAEASANNIDEEAQSATS